jgi:hypothetical protein
MSGAEWVVLTFSTAGESREAAALAQRADAIAATSEDLVRIGLMADIPDQPVVWRVEHRVERHRQLDHTERGAEVAAGDGNRVDCLAAQLSGKLFQLFRRQIAQVGWVPYPVEKRCHGRHGHEQSFSALSCLCLFTAHLKPQSRDIFPPPHVKGMAVTQFSAQSTSITMGTDSPSEAHDPSMQLRCLRPRPQ